MGSICQQAPWCRDSLTISASQLHDQRRRGERHSTLRLHKLVQQERGAFVLQAVRLAQQRLLKCRHMWGGCGPRSMFIYSPLTAVLQRSVHKTLTMPVQPT